MIESSMIRLRVRDHELSSPLITRIYPHARLPQTRWVHQRNELEQQVWLCLEEVGSLTSDCGFELFGVLAWDAVPGFGLAPVHCERECHALV